MPKKKKKRDDDLKHESLKVIKTSFKSIYKNDRFIEKEIKGQKVNIPYIYDCIEDAMLRTNQIVIYTYQFIKLLIIYYYDNNIEIPNIDDKFIKEIYDVLTTRSTHGRQRIDNNENLTLFFNEHFNIEKISKKGLSQILNYTSISMKTAYSNTIIQIFKKVLSKYIYCLIKNNTSELNETKNKKKLKDIKKVIKNRSKEIITSILENKYNEDEFNEIITLLPTNPINDHHIFNLKVNPYSYLKSMIFMNRKLEDLNIKTYSFLPLRNNIIPKYIDIDTKVLIEITDIKGKGNFLKDIENNKNLIWSKYFKMNNRFFRKNTYDFTYHIQTDLIGVSGVFSKFIKEKEVNEIKYITDLSKEGIETLKDSYNFVYCDPGKKQLLYMMDENNKYLKYTINQRRSEIKTDKYQKILENMKNVDNINEISQPLINVNSKTFYFENFKEFLRVKNEVNKNLSFFYIENIVHRKLNFRKYTLKQKSEEKLINKIKKTFTFNKKKPLFIYGNWNISKQMANFVPTPNVYLRKKLSKNFKMLLLDEFRTSCLDYKSEEKVSNIKDKQTNKKIHQVLILTENNKNIGCINRDKNAVRNFKKLTDYYILTGERPERFKRGVTLP